MKANINDPKDWEAENESNGSYEQDEDQKQIDDYWNSEEGQQHAENID